MYRMTLTLNSASPKRARFRPAGGLTSPTNTLPFLLIGMAVHLESRKSSVSEADVLLFNRKCEFYARVTGVKPENVKKLMVTCFADEKARKTAEKLGVEVVTA